MQNLIGNEFLVNNLLIKLHAIDNARLSMYHPEDIYCRIPKLLFRYKNDVNPNLYSEIKKCVESFEGNIKWTMYHDGIPRRYRMVMPELYAGKQCAEGKRQIGTQWDCKDIAYETELYSEEIYKETCEKAIEDIPALANHIQDYFKIS